MLRNACESGPRHALTANAKNEPVFKQLLFSRRFFFARISTTTSSKPRSAATPPWWTSAGKASPSRRPPPSPRLSRQVYRRRSSERDSVTETGSFLDAGGGYPKWDAARFILRCPSLAENQVSVSDHCNTEPVHSLIVFLLQAQCTRNIWFVRRMQTKARICA